MRVRGVEEERDIEKRTSFALKYLEEGKALADKDPVQASEKLYKAAEEVVKALALHFDLGEVIERVERRGEVDCHRAREGGRSDCRQARRVVQVLVGLRLGATRVGLPRGQARLEGRKAEGA